MSPRTSFWRQEFVLTDSRICGVCGSRYGFCDHTEGKREIRTIFLLSPEAVNIVEGQCRSRHKWTEENKRRAVALRSEGMDPSEIADHMSKTVEGVRQVLRKADREARHVS